MLLDTGATVNLLKNYLELPELDISDRIQLNGINSKIFYTDGSFKTYINNIR